jgi:hypothetical protein
MYVKIATQATVINQKRVRRFMPLSYSAMRAGQSRPSP